MTAADEVKAAQVESDATKDLPLPERARGQRRGRSVVQSVRLPEAEFAAIEQLATQLEVPISSLIRGWVLAGLAEERDTSLHSAVDRLAEDANRLRRLVTRDPTWHPATLPQQKVTQPRFSASSDDQVHRG